MASGMCVAFLNLFACIAGFLLLGILLHRQLKKLDRVLDYLRQIAERLEAAGSALASCH
jgi:uncharacterized protein YoxC